MSADALQFQHAEPLGPSPELQCRSCNSEITGSHYKLNGAAMCPGCTAAIQAVFSRGPSRSDVLKALGYGIGAALIGMAVYFAIITATGLGIGWIAVGV